jgi:dihydrofolate synthase/folylpolyglutamate synthase
VFGPLDGLEDTARAVCRERGAVGHLWVDDITLEGGVERFSVTGRGWSYRGLSLPTPAVYQAVNAALAVTACHLLLGELDQAGLRDALAGVTVPGRLQVVGRSPLVLADGAHNPDGVRALAASLAGVERTSPRVGLIAIMRDKGVREMLEGLCPLFDAVVCCAASEPRSLASGELAVAVTDVPVHPDTVLAVSEPSTALDEALRLAGPRGSVVVTGSLYLLADLARLVAGGER